MKKLFLIAAIFLAFEAEAQIALNNVSAVGRGGVMNTFVKDYRSVGVNPANLGRRGAVLSFTVLESGASFNSQTLNHDIFSKFLEFSDLQDISLQDRQDLAKAFTGENVLNVAADINTFALSVSIPKVGGFAFSNRQRAMGHVNINKNFAELAFLANDASIYEEIVPGQTVYVADVFDGTDMKFSWVSEWNVAFGRTIVDLPGISIYGGVGYKYLQGLGLYEYSAHNKELKAYNAASPILTIDYSDFITNPDFNYRSSGSRLNPVGKGSGMDVGVSADIAKVVKVAASITDMGDLTWTENLLEGHDKGFKLPEAAETAGSYNFMDYVTALGEAIMDTSLVFAPVKEHKTKLPTRLRLGVGVKLGSKVEAGVDYVRALNNAPGNITEDFFGLGLEIMVAPNFKVSTGASTGEGRTMNLPIGLAYVSRVYEFGVSTRNVTAPFSEENPGASLAMGFLRFNIGAPRNL
ncbi:DUF5723 family protein [Pontibacter silvestris]|uniref:DUF5723 family protein n=1 Tax=Pontibacter silvestris TaxID=2305183 RepID=A0ABW4X389_9BACT|nr:DUF5723 family protein [Pontibacter silvestris]MCC9137898.1 DUF5723 family protein [Pontibacter silvestris]